MGGLVGHPETRAHTPTCLFSTSLPHWAKPNSGGAIAIYPAAIVALYLAVVVLSVISVPCFLSKFFHLCCHLQTHNWGLHLLSPQGASADLVYLLFHGSLHRSYTGQKWREK